MRGWCKRAASSAADAMQGVASRRRRVRDALARGRAPCRDFAAVAADLVRRGVTRPGLIAAEGASNGGILIANMLVRYPERFGALFCTVPLIDMRRYTRLLAGASWIAEYGDPDKPEDWAFLQTYSAYHLAAPGRTYPPILLATSRRDDRVHPGHARKMAAKLQAMGYEPTSTSPPPAATATARTTRRSRRSPRSATPSSGRRSASSVAMADRCLRAIDPIADLNGRQKKSHGRRAAGLGSCRLPGGSWPGSAT